MEEIIGSPYNSLVIKDNKNMPRNDNLTSEAWATWNDSPKQKGYSADWDDAEYLQPDKDELTLLAEKLTRANDKILDLYALAKQQNEIIVKDALRINGMLQEIRDLKLRLGEKDDTEDTSNG